jgi:hypothetical protein
MNAAFVRPRPPPLRPDRALFALFLLAPRLDPPRVLFALFVLFRAAVFFAAPVRPAPRALFADLALFAPRALFALFALFFAIKPPLIASVHDAHHSYRP